MQAANGLNKETIRDDKVPVPGAVSVTGTGIFYFAERCIPVIRNRKYENRNINTYI